MACVALAAVPLVCRAQTLNDPTRPPAAILANAPADAAQAGGPVLQTVIITPTERAAIIGGERVKLGGKYGDARVVAISESEVVLRSATGTETLRMYPGVDMKVIVPEPAVSTKPAAKAKSRKPAVNPRGKQG